MNVSISYQTLQVPPPFSFAYTIDLKISPSKVDVQFHLEYLNRDSITEEEILEEGYTLDDKFEWTGSLGSVWSPHLKDHIVSCEFKKPADTDPLWIYIKAEKSEGNVRDIEKWDFLLQELIQAVYERSGLELPLQMKFVHKIKGKSHFYELEGSFADRTCKVNGRSIPWEEMQNLMSDIYTLDFKEESTQKPEKDGLWVDPDGQSGYQCLADLDQKQGEKATKSVLKVFNG